MNQGKIIGGKRYCGKTTELIKKASEEKIYILCANKTMARMIFRQAQDMELEIPFPVTVSELPLRGFMNEILIDEVEMVLNELIGKRVIGMSSSMEFEELDSLNKREEQKITYTVYRCLHCSHSEKLSGKREDYKEVTVCPKCNGAFVDQYRVGKYKKDYIDEYEYIKQFTEAVKECGLTLQESSKAIAEEFSKLGTIK
ncbi:hypothetical protein BTS2_0549 [Bacillus sp. TS-2]|nr:hypothetical protein BTS2_0549 [Bacillus sp. TS-2]